MNVAGEIAGDGGRHRSYATGKRVAWLEMLRLCLAGLGIDDPEVGKVSWSVERQETISALRRLCEAFGDNDWCDDLHVPDVIEKHLARHLGER